MHDTWDEHMNALKRIIRYLQGTIRFGLHIFPSLIDDLVSCTDADWGDVRILDDPRQDIVYIWATI